MMTEKESKAMEAIHLAFDSIKEIDDDSSHRLKYNTEELAAAIHVLQSFVKQHILYRQDPKYWSDWWGDRV